MAARSGVGGLAVGFNWHGVVVELLLGLGGLIYGSVGVQRPRGSGLLVSRSLTALFHFHSRMCCSSAQTCSLSLIDWLTRKVEVTLYSLALSANATARYVRMSRVCEPHQVACPRASCTERILNVLSPKAANQSGGPIHGLHQS